MSYLPTRLDTSTSGFIDGGDDHTSTRLGDVELVRHLVELFAEIDVNGDQHMEWNEFAAFIVDKVWAREGYSQLTFACAILMLLLLVAQHRLNPTELVAGRNFP